MKKIVFLSILFAATAGSAVFAQSGKSTYGLQSYTLSIEPTRGHLSEKRFAKVRNAYGFNYPLPSSTKVVGKDSVAAVYRKYRAQVIAPNSFRRGSLTTYTYKAKAR